MPILSEKSPLPSDERDVLGVLVLRPLRHHERVVDRDADDRVDAARLELGEQLVVARNVGVRTGGRERAGEREEHDLFAREHVRCLDVLPLAVGGAGLERDLGNALTFDVLHGFPFLSFF